VHLRRLSFFSDRYPTVEYYPFRLQVFRNTRGVVFDSPVTFFVGENGTGKSTLLEALSHKCKIHIWRNEEGARFEKNFYEDRLCDFIGVEWTDGPVPGSFFSGELFRDFVQQPTLPS
jgi:predicted ATPase